MLELANSLPGYVEVIEQDMVPQGFKTSEGKCLQSFTWVCAWAKDRLQKQAHYIGVGCFVQDHSPYVYCLVNIIYNNESVTLCLTIGTSEDMNLYNTAYEAMIKSGIEIELLRSFPVHSCLWLPKRPTENMLLSMLDVLCYALWL